MAALADLRAEEVPDSGPGLASLARSLLGPGVAVAGGPVAAWAAPLWPGEAAAVARAVPRRREEFAAGRAAARAALARLGLPPAPLPRGPGGPPLWPAGVVGSLSHGGGVALAALGREGPLRALGLDLEPHRALDGDVAALVLAGDEGEPVRVFSAKEAAYKAQFALTGALLGFGDLRIAWGPGGAFTATFTRPVGPFAQGDRLRGRQALHPGPGGLLVTAVRA